MVIFHRLLNTIWLVCLLLFVGGAYASSKGPSINVDCKIDIKDYPGFSDYSVEKNNVLIEGTQFSKTGRVLINSIENYEFRVIVAESLSIGEESEITGFFTEIKNIKSGLSSQSHSGVNYINDKSRESQVTLLYYEKTSLMVKGYVRFECSSKISGPNIMQKLNKQR